MEVIILNDADTVARQAAGLVLDLVTKKRAAVLGLATGNTPLALYRHLIEKYRNGEVSFRDVTSFNLDEYLGISPENHLSYRYFMNENLFRHIDIQLENTHLPDGMTENPRNVGLEYERTIFQAGGIDLQVLGIGSNGHIGFNEPTSSLASRTRVKTLTRSTIRDNSQSLKPGEFQPHLAITMGIGTILEARRILLLAVGSHKAEAVKAAIEGPLSAKCPASVLQQHEHVTVLLDESAAEQLELREYYRWANHENQELHNNYRNYYEQDSE